MTIKNMLLGLVAVSSILTTTSCTSNAQIVYVYGPPPPAVVIEPSPSVVVVAPSPFFYFGPSPVYPRWHSYGRFRHSYCPPPVIHHIPSQPVTVRPAPPVPPQKRH